MYTTSHPVPETAKISTKKCLSKLERHRLIYKNEIPEITKCLANFQSNSDLYSPTPMNLETKSSTPSLISLLGPGHENQ